MCKFRCLVCLILLFGPGFGSQPDECLLKKQQLVVSLDWHKEISRPNSIEFSKYDFFNNRGISNLTFNDTMQMQGLQTDASRVTFEKVMLESLGGFIGGAAGFGIAFGFTRLLPRHSAALWQGAIMCVSVPIGLAGGTTITGNLVMEPDGSFKKSFYGMVIGALVGLPVVTIAGFSGVEGNFLEPSKWKAKPITYILFTVSALCPISGAVIGYNHNISQKSVVPMISPEENEFLDGSSQRHYPSVKLPLITLRF